MLQSRILAMSAPVLALFGMAHVAHGLGVVGPGVAISFGIAAALSLVPAWVRAQAGRPEPARLGVEVLALALSAALVAGAWSGPPRPWVEIVSALAHAATAGLLVGLSVAVPEGPVRGARLARLRWAGYLVFGASAGIGLLGLAPPVPLDGARVLLFPARLAAVPRGSVVAAIGVALLIWSVRRRSGAQPALRAAATYPLTGLAVAAGLLALTSAVPARVYPATASVLQGAAALAVVAGHLAALNPAYRVVAGPFARQVMAAGLTAGAGALALSALLNRAPTASALQAVALGAAVLGAVGLHCAFVAVVYRAFAPARGRLLHAIRDLQRGPIRAPTIEDFAASVLRPFRTPATTDAGPMLLVCDPEITFRVDAAGEARPHLGPQSRALIDRLTESPGAILVRSELESQVVRRSDLRPVIEWLVAEDVLCVVPLASGGVLEGALVVPRDRRRSPLALEEIRAFEKAAAPLTAVLYSLCAVRRSQRRLGETVRDRNELAERLEALADELQRESAHARVLKAGARADRLAEKVIAYSRAMRALMRRVEDVAPVDCAVLLVGEGGVEFEQVAYALHEGSGRKAAACVVADCGAVRPERMAAAMFGEGASDGTSPGWLRLAEGGTLLLVDCPALSLEVQRALVTALAERRASQAGDGECYGVDVRVVATTRVPLAGLVATEGFDAEFARWLGAVELTIPALRERPEDLSSLVLLGLDRAARTLGHEPVGIDDQAMSRLMAHPFPGNLRELQAVLDRSVRRAGGSRIGVRDLMDLGPETVQVDGAEEPILSGDYLHIERKILAHALERAGGNKSAAARMLGLPRTTFIDKLRRHDEESAPASAAGSALPGSSH